MIIHREGIKILISLLIVLLIANYLVYIYLPVVFILVLIASILFYFFVISFFRNPKREIVIADNHIIYAPADGKIVALEEVLETEYFNEKRLQVSIFMSPTNVHVNRNPIGGTVNYFKYHPGKYLVAWHPKSSEENERTTTVIGNGQTEILLRQIAGAVAKRIVNYLEVGQQVVQGKDMGFIKFGSRVDLFLPLTAKIEVSLNQKVKGNKTVIARIS